LGVDVKVIRRPVGCGDDYGSPMADDGASIEIGQRWQAIGAPDDWIIIVEPAGEPESWIVRMAVGLERAMPAAVIHDSYELV
jgi:hypothetical protein